MNRYLLDTNILITHLRKPDYLDRVFADLPTSAEESLLLVSVVSVAELRSIVRRNGWSQRRIEEMERFLQQLTVINISADNPYLLDAYVDIDIYSINISRKMTKNDLWIAATALVAKATLITGDKDFDHLAASMDIVKPVIN